MFWNFVLHLYQITKILDLSKLKAFADDKIYVTEKKKLALERVENLVGKGENAGYQHFLFFPQFSKGFLYMVVKLALCGKQLNHDIYCLIYHSVSKKNTFSNFWDNFINPLPHNAAFHHTKDI